MKFIKQYNIRESFLKDFNEKTFRDDFSYDYKVVGLFTSKISGEEKYYFILECVNNYTGQTVASFNIFLKKYIKAKIIFFNEDYSGFYKYFPKSEFLNNFEEIK